METGAQEVIDDLRPVSQQSSSSSGDTLVKGKVDQNEEQDTKAPSENYRRMQSPFTRDLRRQQSIVQSVYPRRLLLGIIFMCGQAFFNVISSSLAQTVQEMGRLSFADLLLMRNIPNLILQLAISRWTGQSICREIDQKDRATFLVRIAGPSMTFLCTCMALQQIEVAVYTVIFQTAPFLSSIGTWLVLKEPIGRADFIAMLLCFFAVVVIVIYKGEHAGEDENELGRAPILGMIFALGSALSNSLVNVNSKKLQHISFSVITFYSSLLACIFWICQSVGVYSATESIPITQLPPSQLGVMLLLGISESIFLCVSALAYQYGKPSTVGLFSYTNVLWAFLMDMAVFGRPFHWGVFLPTIFIATITVSLGVKRATALLSEHKRLTKIASKGFTDSEKEEDAPVAKTERALTKPETIESENAAVN